MTSEQLTEVRGQWSLIEGAGEQLLRVGGSVCIEWTLGFKSECLGDKT